MQLWRAVVIRTLLIEKRMSNACPCTILARLFSTRNGSWGEGREGSRRGHVFMESEAISPPIVRWSLGPNPGSIPQMSARVRRPEWHATARCLPVYASDRAVGSAVQRVRVLPTAYRAGRKVVAAARQPTRNARRSRRRARVGIFRQVPRDGVHRAAQSSVGRRRACQIIYLQIVRRIDIPLWSNAAIREIGHL